MQIYKTQCSNLNSLKSLNYIRFILIHGHVGNVQKNKCQLSYGQVLTDGIIISKPLNSDMPQEKRDKILPMQKNIWEKVKEYIDTNL